MAEAAELPLDSGRRTLPTRRKLTIATVALVVVVAFVQFGFLRHHSLRNNEFITLRVIGLPYREIIQERPTRNHLPGYFLALKAWTEVFGTSEVALRLPSAVAVFAGVVVVWRLAARLYGARAGLLALGLCGLNQIHAQMGTDARMYSFLFFGSALALWAFVLYVETGRRRYAVVLALAGLATLGMHLLHLFVIAGVVIYTIVRRRALAGRVAGSLLSALAPVVLWLPLIVYWASVEDKLGADHPWRSFYAMRAVRQMAIVSLGEFGPDGGARVELGGALFLLVYAGVTVAVWRRWRHWRRGAGGGAARAVPAGSCEATRYIGLLWLFVFLPLIGIPLGGLRASRQLVKSWRYYVTAAAAAPLLLTAGWVLLRCAGRRRIAAIFAAVCGVVVLVNLASFLASPGCGVREIVLHIGAHYRGGDIVVTSRRYARSRAFPYYGVLDGLPIERPRGLNKPERLFQWLCGQCAGARRLWMVFYGDDPDEPPIAGVLARHPSVFVPAGHAVALGQTAAQLYQLTLPPNSGHAPWRPLEAPQ